MLLCPSKRNFSLLQVLQDNHQITASFLLWAVVNELTGLLQTSDWNAVEVKAHEAFSIAPSLLF